MTYTEYVMQILYIAESADPCNFWECKECKALVKDKLGHCQYHIRTDTLHDVIKYGYGRTRNETKSILDDSKD